jgi:diguanylate cyclase (GGDEF)-like protein
LSKDQEISRFRKEGEGHSANEIEKEYIKRLRALRIIHNLSEFLKVLSVNDGDILKSMLIKFACEVSDASRGSLLIRDNVHKELYYYDTCVYENGLPVLEDFNERIDKYVVSEKNGHLGTVVDTKHPLLIEKVWENKKYNPYVDDVLKMKAGSVICVPVIVDEELIGILELVNETDKDRFNELDLEAVTIVSNLAMATMENAKLFKWAISDGLTGLFNIHFFKRVLEQEVKKTQRYGGELSVIMLDADSFKDINDTYGHQAGDKVLVKLSDILKNKVRQDIDIPGRYGGDEFIVMLPNTGIIGAKVVAERILENIREAVVSYGDNDIKFTSSIGVGELEEGMSLKDIISNADKAMYLSKKSGKNSVCIYAKS